jgi:hypothetical protein
MSDDDSERGGGGNGEERLTLVPSLFPGVDLSRFTFDPETESLLAMMDGRMSIGDLADLAGVDAGTAVERLERLSQAGIVTSIAPEDPGDGGARGRGSAIAVFEDAAKEGFSGAIRFERDRVRIAVHFEKGAPLAVSSDDPAHDVGAILSAAGRIDDATAAAYREAVARGAGSPALALFKAGVTERRDLGRLLTWHGSMVLKELGTWTGFVSEATPDEPFPAALGRCPLVVPRRAEAGAAATRPPVPSMAGWRDRELDEAEALVLEQSRPRYMVASPRAGQIIASFGLGDREQRLVDHLLGTPTQVSRAMAISSAFRSVTRRLIVRLITSGAFDLHETNPEGDTPHDLEDLEPCARRMANDNYFDLLTAHAISSPVEIRERYEKRRHEFDPTRYPGATEEQRRALDDIRAHLDRAFAVLFDKEKRRAYRRQVCGPDQIQNFLDLQLRKAEVALKMRDDPRDALALAESVLDIEPAEITGRLLKAGSLARLGHVAEARALLSSIGSVPQRMANDLKEIQHMAGLT